MFLIKKMLAPFFMPLSVIMFISILGLLFLWFSKKQNIGKLLVTVGIMLLAFLSYEQVANRLIEPLENKYVSYDNAVKKSVQSAKQSPAVQFVVVLGGGHITEPDIPITSQISSPSLTRLIEGIRIYRKQPGSKLILSGGVVFDPSPEAATMANVAKSIGIPEADIILETASRDTKDQARNIKAIVGNMPFVLVTSASHMPRAISMFQTAGMNPIPAPTDHMLRRGQKFIPYCLFPDSKSLHKAERAIYEYLGTLWAKINGQIKQQK